jgi:hypothetical protein
MMTLSFGESGHAGKMGRIWRSLPPLSAPFTFKPSLTAAKYWPA